MNAVHPWRRLGAALVVLLLALPAFAAGERGTAEEAQALVARAIAHYDAAGGEAAFAAFQVPAGDFVDRDLYVFVFGPGGTIVSHGGDAELVGVPADGLVDVDGVPFGAQFMEQATADGVWIDYKWKDPVTGDVQPKSSWVVLHDGHVFGVGIYKP
jgi:cytochrome c